MIRVKSVSQDGVFYLVNGWSKYGMWWHINPNDQRVLFKDMRSAKCSLTKVMKLEPDFMNDIITFETV